MKILERWISSDRWETVDWQCGCGWWDGAFELYLGKWIIRFSPHRADFR